RLGPMDQLVDRAIAMPPISCIKLLDRQRRAGFQDTALGNEAGQTACGIGSAAKSEDKNLVARLERFGKPCVCIDNLIIDAITFNAASSRFSGICSYPLAIIRDLVWCVGVA